ncbi:MAG: low affinity iron permease family protein [Mesorhizobium sp.]|nr:MAG: low affinity iron permease family protein [Mesorhizobium sp.]RWM05254.1 MAG: low affinity iron permease family protein [Mesorhizobium sp.]TIP43226.1 MAG: low affinity iron permease family protein [Mesorhizobium sp.]TJV74690.1 MAG: low affinity iron permease family protein [Mesorhizobium sp.]
MERTFSKVANWVAHLAGLPWTFVICVLIVVVWAASGPIFGFSDTWQLVINTGTTIVTFLMVFLIQNTQNRDGAAIQAKLDELIRVSRAHNHFIGIEHLTESEVEEIRSKCEAAAKRHDREIAEKATDKATAGKNGTRHAAKTTSATAKKPAAGKNTSKKKAAA